MIVQSIVLKKSTAPISVIDCYVGKGYRQGKSGSLPDVDIDYQSDRRQEVKEYLERRYNKNGLQRVFSAGTFTTMKLKAVLKDVARIHNVPVYEVNYITKIIDDDSMDYTGLFRLAYSNKKVKEFIMNYPQVIEDIRTLMGQPRSSSIHASAIIITPETKDGKTMECFDYLPIKKIDDILVSEIDGYSIDDIGLLKNDCLGIKELTKLQKTRDLVVKEYGDSTTFLDIITDKLEDEKAYKLFTNGFTQNIFQFGSAGMTKFVMEMKPTQISDLIAANALFRPATIESGSTETYVACKNGDKDPVYLWGTYDILKDSFGVLFAQEDLARMACEIGGFSLAEGVHLVKFISKKKIEKIHAMKDKFIEGAKAKGCPDEDAQAIWSLFESAGSYLFNKCISGKETIKGLGDNMGYDIAKLYELFHNGSDHNWKAISVNNQYEATLNYLVDIRYMGKRELYEIKLGNGRTIRVTENHKHPTNDGEKRTDELIIGKDMMLYLNDNNHVSMSVVESIEPIGIDDVYDIEMADPYHNFCTGEGIFTCNSHATAYALTAYLGAWYKANYPTAFYTVALEYAKDENISVLMAEMEQASSCKIVHPDINVSGVEFETDYKKNEIYWSLSRVKFVGVESVNLIVSEREKNGPYASIEDFCSRIFRKKLLKLPGEERCPVNSRQVKNLILAGCFDKVEGVLSVLERYAVLEKAANILGFEISEADFPPEKIAQHYFWSMLQISISGIGSVDYKRVFDNSDFKTKLRGASYKDLERCFQPDMDGKKAAVCATVVEFKEKSFEDKEKKQKKYFGVLTLQQNTEIMELIVWPENYEVMKGQLMNAKDHILLMSCMVKWSNFSNQNGLQDYKGSILEII